MPLGMYSVQPNVRSSATNLQVIHILHRRGAALSVSTTWAMRRPLLRGTDDRFGSTFFRNK